MTVSGHLVRPTRRFAPWGGRGPRHCLLLGLAPDGGCLAIAVTCYAGGLLHHLFTLTPGLRRGRFVSVARSTSRLARVLPGIVPYGVRTFLTHLMCATACPTQPRFKYYPTLGIGQFAARSSHNTISGGARNRARGAPSPSTPRPRLTYKVVPRSRYKPISYRLPQRELVANAP